MFQFPECPAYHMIHDTLPELFPRRVPHSDIHGSRPVCGSPWFSRLRVFVGVWCPGIHPAFCSLINFLLILLSAYCYACFSVLIQDDLAAVNSLQVFACGHHSAALYKLFSSFFSFSLSPFEIFKLLLPRLLRLKARPSNET